MNLFAAIQDNASGSVVVPDKVWECESLKPTDIKLYKVILDYSKLIMGRKDGKFDKNGTPIIDVSQKTLAEKVGVSDRTIQTCLNRLKDVGLIIINNLQGYKNNNKYKLSEEFFTGKKEKGLRVVEKTTKPKKKKEEVTIKKVAKNNSVYAKKLEELGGHIYSDRRIIEISKHYNMLASNANNYTGYNSLPKKNPQKHKNWIAFQKLDDLCTENGWDVKLYLEAQFDRADKYWKNSRMKYPLPNMLRSVKAQEYYVRWIKDREEKYKHDVSRHHKVVAKRTVSVRRKVIQEIVQSVELVSMYIRSNATEQEREEDKALRIYHNWEGYSAAYLYSIDWFREFIYELDDSNDNKKRIDYVKEQFAMFDKSKSLQEVIRRTVEQAEERYEVPENLAI